ncbi:MAG: holo-ACP synthase [Ferruginibacter sp.]
MIAGLGMDMIEVERVAQKIAKESGFRELVFSKNEIEYCEPKANKFEHYAARFAAKEAFFKALGTGWVNGTAFNEIEISKDEKGKPILALLGETANVVAALNIKHIFVTLAHLKTVASAVVIIEQ